MRVTPIIPIARRYLVKIVTLTLFYFGALGDPSLWSVEIGSMHTDLTAVGSDSSADVVQNPAMLSFSSTTSEHVVLLRDTFHYYINFSNPLFGENIITGLLANQYSFGYAFKNPKKGGISVSLYANTDFQDALDNMGYYQPYQTIIPSNMSVISKSMNFTYEPLGVNAGLGLSYKFSESQSVGLSFIYTYFSLNFLREYKVNIGNTALGLTGYTEQKETTTLTRQKMALLLGYVSQSEMGEFGISLVPFSYRTDIEDKKMSYLYNLNGTNIDAISATSSNENQIFEPIVVQAGISQKLFPFMKVYIEGSVIIPWTFNYRLDVLHSDSAGNQPQILSFDVEETYDFSPSIKLGLAFFLPADFNLYTGFSYFTGKKTYIYTNPKSKSDNVAKDYEITDLRVQLGISKLFAKHILAYFSVGYLFASDTITESKYVLGSLSDSSYTSDIHRLDFFAGTEYHF